MELGLGLSLLRAIESGTAGPVGWDYVGIGYMGLPRAPEKGTAGPGDGVISFISFHF